MSDNVHVALLMMVKNETKRLLVSLESTIGYVNSIVIYDTGSTDDTIEILQKFSAKYKIPLRLKQGEFENFATSRNIALDFADTFDDIDYLLLMDTNDEIRGGKNLRKYCVTYKDKPNTGFLLCQEWFSGKYDKYYNVRMIKNRKGWRYRGRVHEWIKNTRYENDDAAIASGDITIRLEEDIVLYQDRTQDDDKTGKRFIRDKALLLQDHLDDPTEPRTLFYLAQTCSCTGDVEESLKYYTIRSTLEGFWEERFHAYYRCGDLTASLNQPWDVSMKWYIKAFEYAPRAEPLIKIAEYYKDKNWFLSYSFADMACKLTYPSHCILFVDKQAYDYNRWHVLGVAGWYSGFHKEGKIGCIKAIESANKEVDKNNLSYYEKSEK